MKLYTLGENENESAEIGTLSLFFNLCESRWYSFFVSFL